jgi:TonB family protein
LLLAGGVSAASAQENPTGSTGPLLKPPAAGAAANFPPEYFARGVREAPGLLKSAGVACTVTQATYIGSSTFSEKDGKKGQAELYEAACAKGLGYLLIAQANRAPEAVNCVTAAQTGKIACMLPNNRHPAEGLDNYFTTAGVDCHAMRARLIGEDLSAKFRRFEVECGEGGYVLDIPLADGSGPAPVVGDCLQFPGLCVFTPHAESVASLAHKVGEKLGTDCKVSDARYVGYVEAQKSDLYEVSCQSGHAGLLLELDQGGALRGSMPCSGTKLVGATCQLKSSDTVDPLIAYAEESGASPPLMVTDPDWLSKPSGADLSSLYPDKALSSGISGQVRLKCRTTVSGFLADCFALDESPLGFGFGKAALRMANKFRMKPATHDGVPVGGTSVVVPINFGMFH